MSRRATAEVRTAERFEAAPSWLVDAVVVLVAAACAAAWTALGTAAAGRFAPRLAWAAGGAVALAVAAWRARAPRTADDPPAGAGGTVWTADVACLVVIALLLPRLAPAVAWPAALDGGWYAATAVRIAADRGLSFDAPAAALPGLTTPLAALRAAGIDGAPDDAGRGFYAVAMAAPRVGAPRVTPYHPPLFTASAALGVAWRGPYGAAWSAVVWALLWLGAIAALARAAGLGLGAPVAVALAGLSPLWRVYGSTPYAELCAGTMGLASLIALQEVRAGRGHGHGARARAFGAGLLAASAAVAKLDLAPFAALALLAWAWTAGGRAARAALAGAALPAAAFLLLATGPTAVYARLNGAGIVGWLGDRVGVAAVIGGASLALGLAFMAGRRRRWGRTAPVRVSRAAALAVLLATGAGVSWAAVGGDGVGMAPLLGWAATPLALFAAGLAVVWLADHPRQAPPAAWPLLLATAAVLVAPIVTRDLSPLYTARRLAPIALPTVCLLAGAVVERAQAAAVGWRRFALAGLVAAALASAAIASAPLRPSREFAAVELLLDRLAQHVEPGDLVVFPDAYAGDLAARLAAPLWALHRIDVGVLSPDAAASRASVRLALDAVAAEWRSRPGAGRVLWAATADAAPPAGVRVDALALESLVSEAWVPGAMPPRLAPIELSIALGVVQPDDNSR